MTQGRTASLLVIILFLSACGSQIHHFVRKGETLYSISYYYGVDYHDVARWNHIQPPYVIAPGQRLRVAPPAGEAQQAGRPVTVPAESKTVVSRPPATPDPAQWRWPAPGKLVGTFSTGGSSNGIDISNREGTPIRATASGKVVYAGRGLSRYGNLVIIKHSGKYLSAYAYNKKLFVSEGEQVNGGQIIAEMGRNPANRAMLHFEIRAYGQPVDPKEFLSDR